MTTPDRRSQPDAAAPSTHRRARYDDDYDDDIDVDRRRGRPRDRDGHANPTSAGIFGFLAALMSLGLLIIVLVLWIFLRQDQQQQQNIEQTRLMTYWFLFLDVVSFAAGLVATILGARGTSPANPLYRGYALTALIFGIIEMIVTVVFGFILTCAVLIVEAMRNNGG